MPNRKQPSYFDREKILSQLNTTEAPRPRGDRIYCALIKELFQEGCVTWAKHLQNLTEKESLLYKTRVIRDRLCDDRNLLMALFENMLAAERVQVVKSGHGYRVTLKCLYQIIQLLEPHKFKYEWFLENLYQIITPICAHVESLNISHTAETIARIYFKIAQFSSEKDSSLLFAINFMEKAMQLSRDEVWKSDYITEREWGVYPTLHLVAGRELATLLLRYAELAGQQDPQAAEQYAQKAAVALAEVGLDANKISYCRALLARAKYLLQLENYDAALKLLQRVRKDLPDISDPGMPRVLSDLHLYEGICAWNSNDMANALHKMKAALQYAVKSAERCRQADVLIAIGRVYAHATDKNLAREAFTRAKHIYTELGDVLNRKKAHYMLAKLKSDEIFPYFMDLLKDGTEKFCGFYNLRQWKNSCKKFWITAGAEQLKEDKIYCLLEDEIKNTFGWSGDEIK